MQTKVKLVVAAETVAFVEEVLWLKYPRTAVTETDVDALDSAYEVVFDRLVADVAVDRHSLVGVTKLNNTLLVAIAEDSNPQHCLYSSLLVAIAVYPAEVELQIQCSTLHALVLFYSVCVV